MKKLLIGGSPCTHWSIAQIKHRETEASGIGWELFENYQIAKEKFQPDFFLYENNWSASSAIKQQIETALGCSLMRINSNLVSAQRRDRFYVFNWDVEMPEDRGIMLRDILETSGAERDVGYPPMPVPEATKKGYTLVFPGDCVDLAVPNSKSRRGRLMRAKSNCLTASASELYEYCGTISNPLYEYHGDYITANGKQFPVRVRDGQYIVRKFTPVERERLQTLPDGYTAFVSDTQRSKGLGNGWTAEVVIHILSGALASVPRDEKLLVLSMYDGIGTGRYCLEKMGFTNVEYHAYEVDKYAMAISSGNYPDIIHHGDAFQVRDDGWSLEKGESAA